MSDYYSKDEDISMDLICSATGKRLTDEQKIFASRFIEPTISFSDAGTGKTYAAAVGIVEAQVYHKVPGDKICVLSFTRESATEISQRYDLMMKYQFGITPASFSTFHSLCNAVLNEAWGKVNILKGHVWQDDTEVIKKSCVKHGLAEITDAQAKKILVTIDSMNANFIFDKDNLSNMLRFKELRMEPALFNAIRVDWFYSQLIMRKIPQGDIPIHAYYILKNNKSVREKYSKMFDILVIDEFQDMSVLYLKIVFELAKSVIVIGDMKQQIYAFNGASDSITDEFLKVFPNARICKLTQSFRCKDEILDKAMEFEMPNKPPFIEYSGIGKGGTVNIVSSKTFDFNALCSKIYNMQQNRETVEQRSIMFLSRNNLSIMDIIERLYRNGVQFRTTKFKRVMDIPIFSELCILIDAIESDTNVQKVGRALRLFKEFRYKQRDNQIPILGIIDNQDIGWLDINYKYKESYWPALIHLFKQVKQALKNDIPCTRIFNSLLPVYENYIIEGNWWRLEFEKEFYINLVAPVIGNKTYKIMRAEENEKASINEKNMSIYSGVRCYTIHSAKGLEADDVYIVDCDDKIVPSAKNFDRYIKNKCYYEAARMIRNERNLLYVATTRARHNVTMLYNQSLSELISSPSKNKFSYIDEIYWNNHTRYFNDESFMALFNFSEE